MACKASTSEKGETITMNVCHLGLGSMGRALAQVLAGAPSVSLIVWNRTVTKAEAFAAECDVKAATTLLSAIQASEVVVACLTDYNVTMQLLNEQDVAEALRGKLLLQLSNGSAGDAKRLSDWAEEHEVPYLDGSIMGSPSSIATSQGGVSICGPEELWNKYADLVRVFGPLSFYAGPDRPGGKGTNAAITGLMATALIGFIHSVAVANAYGTPPEMFVEICEGLMETLKDQWKTTADNWVSSNRDTLQNGTATVDLWVHEIRTVFDAAQEAGVNTEIFRVMMDLLENVRASGDGSKDISVLLDALKQGL